MNKDNVFAFRSKPSSILDPPAELDLSEQCNAEFISVRNWLDNVVTKLEELPFIPSKEAESRRAALIRQVKRNLARLDQVLQDAWELSMAKEGLLSFVKAPTSLPAVQPQGKLTRFLIPVQGDSSGLLCS